MQKRKIIWVMVAAILWCWAALVAGEIFPKVPLLFDSPAGNNMVGLSALFELFLLGALALFLLIFNPSRNVWLLTLFVGVLLLLKGVWLAPLLLSSLEWEYPPLSYLPAIYAFTELIKFVLLLLTSFWIYTEITTITRVEERYQLFISTRNAIRNHLSPDHKLNDK
ncbi:hypothetical protein [Adhaeribacter rhizoryzae]|uniref:Uncharacterized protein n=1 Tax=Adhaeribacter rhizoryzae TaxID=2607907 RepID=A0A5M6CXN7_9BACT|nr:hypothetical protein [Adhaeribacter rhizoryzae]KAA5539961.1 hypothetical protein F0145_23520 [Adhaeribacter rhizoryzae]